MDDGLAGQRWETLADVLLAREAALCRIVAGVPPRDFAGLYIGNDDVDRLLRAIPGLDGPEPADVAEVRARFEPAVAGAMHAFAAELTGAGVFADLIRRARLRLAEAEVLALVTAVELHPQRQRLVAYIQDSVQLPRLTLATLGQVFGPSHPGERAVAPGSALDQAGLVSVDVSGPWSVRMCGVPPRVLWALRGSTAPDPELPRGMRVLPPLLTNRRDETPEEPQVLLVHGADRDSRLLQGRRQCPGTGTLVLSSAVADDQWPIVVREATVAGLAVLVELAAPAAVGPAALAAMECSPQLSWVVSSATELPLETMPRRSWLEIEVSDGTANAEDWQEEFGIAKPPDGARLSREQLRLVAAAAGGDVKRLADGFRRLAGGHLESLAVRVRPRRKWTDLVLPSDQMAQLRELAARYRQREVVYGAWGFPAVPSTGVVALFAGPSGTGKTLAAEVIAADLELDLYKVDLSSVVSKWIGETEKNLGKIFDAAGAGDLVLFFDEADALFGKRSEVTDAHDRYANIEVAYLLQRLEAYDGIVVMATNLQRNIDQAFVRRISVAVDFALPDERQRRAIWELAFPATAPLVDVDRKFLAAQFKVSGGNIRNVAVTAAFLAAEAGQDITMAHVMLAMKREFQKLGRMLIEAEFGPYLALVSGDA
ncbi:hypothetical protein acdb102_22680 [Acidothermaceae bacterium B102]|nr:hypothetical protein acdb102_22680 [Acidothermaceae bacterium B102]